MVLDTPIQLIRFMSTVRSFPILLKRLSSSEFPFEFIQASAIDIPFRLIISVPRSTEVIFFPVVV